jgi:hypothetical protein
MVMLLRHERQQSASDTRAVPEPGMHLLLLPSLISDHEGTARHLARSVLCIASLQQMALFVPIEVMLPTNRGLWITAVKRQ